MNEENFRTFIQKNENRLLKTRVSLPLMVDLVTADIITEFDRAKILHRNLTEHESAFELWQILRGKFEHLDAIIRILGNKGITDIVRILQEFIHQANAEENVVDSGVCRNRVTPVLNPPMTVVDTSGETKDIWPLEDGLEHKLDITGQTIQGYKSSRGHVFLVNVREFQPENRLGAEWDTESACEIFDSINWRVTLVENPTEQKLESAINDFKRDLEKRPVDCVVFIIMSHGSIIEGRETIITRDGGSFPILDGFVSPFNNSNCPRLRNIPKIFVFNYCRGSLSDYGTDRADARFKRGEAPKLPNMPTLTDILLCWSTLPGHVSFLNDSQGSWFIQLFCNAVKSAVTQGDKEKRQIENVLQQVAKEMETRKSSDGGEKQTCEWRAIGWRHSFYFPLKE